MSVGAIGVMWGSGRATIALSLSAPGADRPHRVRTGLRAGAGGGANYRADLDQSSVRYREPLAQVPGL